MTSARTGIARSQSGLTLIEIMVALLLSSLILLGVAQIFAGNRETQRFQSALTRIQENARFAIDDLSYNMRQTGYRGCGSGAKNINNMLTGPGAPRFNPNAGADLRGHRWTGSAWTPANPQIPNVQESATVLANDVLAITVPDPAANATVDAPFNMNNANLSFTPNAQIAQCDVVMISNCTNMFVFVNVNNSVNNGTVTHSQGGNCLGSGVNVRNSTNSIPVNMAGANLLRFKSYTYYIDQPAGRDVPSLFRVDEDGATEELVPGVQAMSLDYGEDQTGDGQVDAYTGNPAAVADWTNVVAVRVELLMVSNRDRITDEPQTYTFNGNTTTAGDNRLRQVVSTTVSIRNRTP